MIPWAKKKKCWFMLIHVHVMYTVSDGWMLRSAEDKLISLPVASENRRELSLWLGAQCQLLKNHWNRWSKG